MADAARAIPLFGLSQAGALADRFRAAISIRRASTASSRLKIKMSETANTKTVTAADIRNRSSMTGF